MVIPWETLVKHSQSPFDDFHTYMKGDDFIMGYIYCFTNIINNKKYIGQTILDNNGRYNRHIYSATHKEASDYEVPIHAAIRKYGIDNFNYEILAKNIQDTDLLNLLEIYYIDFYQSQTPNGYNIQSGGKNAPKLIKEESKEKMMWAKGQLTEQEVIALRIAYANHESPKAIYEEKYKDHMHYQAFLNIWTGKRYSTVMPELIVNGRHTKITQDIADEIRNIYANQQPISYETLAKKYKVSKATIADIVKGRTWNKKTKEPVSTIP